MANRRRNPPSTSDAPGGTSKRFGGFPELWGLPPHAVGVLAFDVDDIEHPLGGVDIADLREADLRRLATGM